MPTNFRFQPGRLVASARGTGATALAVVSFFGVFCNARAQTPTPAPTVTTPADDFGPNHLDVPFVLRNNWIVMEVKLAKDADALSSAPVLHFLLDTGCTNTTVSEEAFESNKLDLKASAGAKGRDHLTGVGPSSEAVSRVVDTTIEFAGATATAEVEVIAMGSDMKNAQVDGFIGSNLIKNCVIVIDYDKRMVRFYSAQEFKAPNGASKFIAIPIESDSLNEPVAELELTPFGCNCSRVRLALDTGDMGAVTLYSPFVSRNKWQEALSRTTASQSAGLGGRIDVSTGKLRALTFGGTTLDQPPADFSASALGATASTEADGQLGGRVFRRFTMIFDYGHKMLYVRPNVAAKGPFPEQYYFGFSRSSHAVPSTAYTIGFVEPGSPAASADLRVGDIILAIDGQAIGTMTGNEVDASLQQSGKARKFDIVRATKSMTLTIEPIAY